MIYRLKRNGTNAWGDTFDAQWKNEKLNHPMWHKFAGKPVAWETAYKRLEKYATRADLQVNFVGTF